jgi:tetratricopeptide (TPR) repeat protein
VKQTNIAIILLFSALTGFSQSQDPLYLSLRSGSRFPISEASDVLSIGVFGDFTADYSLPFFPPLSLRGSAGYVRMPIDSEAKDVVHTIEGGAGLGFRPPLFGRFNGILTGEVGYFYAPVSDSAVEPGRNAWISASAGIEFAVAPGFRLGISGDYRKYFDFQDSIGIGLSAAYRPIRTRPVEIYQMELDEVFPMLLKHYDTTPLGKVTLVNTGNLDVQDLSVRFFVSRYMDEPKECPAPEGLRAGETVDVGLFALFSPEVLNITEDNTKASAKVLVSYTQQGKTYTQESVGSMSFFNRNAIVWDDDRKAAAYVTAKDPVVLEVSNNVFSWIRGIIPRGFDRSLGAAMAVHEILGMYGIAYVIDPNTPFEDIHQNKEAVDYLKFPRQTLAYGAGDCDDLSILYSALLESIAVDTAFITTPGHIYLAFALDTPPEEALDRFLFPEDIIVMKDRAWIPFEVTLVGEDFALAWETGARQWRQYQKSGEAAFFANSESWSTYGSVGFLEGTSTTKLPDRQSFQSAFSDSLRDFVDREIDPRVTELKERISNSGGSARYMNHLGVLYARYGLIEEARHQFQAILRKEDYPSAAVNLGNLQLLEGDLEDAQMTFRGLYDRGVRPSVVLLQLARISYNRNDFEQAERYYNELQNADQELAGRFDYLARSGRGNTRAAAATLKEVMIWVED